MRSITVRLTLSFLAISLLAIALVALFSGWTTNREFERFILDQNRSGLLADLGAYYEANGTWEGVEKTVAVPEGSEGGFDPSRAPFTLVDANGYVICAGPGYFPAQKVSAEDLAEGTAIQVGGSTVGTVMAWKSSFSENPMEQNFRERTRMLLLYSVLGTASLALILGIVFSRKITHPILELTAATEAVSSGKFGEMVTVRSRDELGKLATSFNSMSSQLARNMEVRRQMTADIAHALRTPLSLILGHAEAVHDGVLPPTQETFEIVREEALRLENLVNDLRTLSLADAGELRLNLQPVSLEKFLEDVCGSFQRQYSRRNIALVREVMPHLPEVVLDPGRMAQVIGNILENSLRHTPEGGRVVVSARQEKGCIAITISDSGPGVASEEINRIFDRFYRSDPSRQHTDDSGSGLGLAIAKSIVEQHKGNIRALSEAGRGLTVVIELPL